MFLTNIDIVDDIDCLQVLQHSSGSDIYLRVGGGNEWTWALGPTIDESRESIRSASAGGTCPAQPSNAVNEKVTSWRFYDNGWKNADIRFTCITHL